MAERNISNLMAMILDSINGPLDLKKLSPADLPVLAKEIRDLLVSTVTNSGGHLASNLGVVELTIALHRVYDSPRDKILWDVGHQSYVHKLLTGRRERFGTLRQEGGLSGFPDPQESPHDPIAMGHASTSISAALGLAVARDLRGEGHSVVAVIGDGSLTGGMAFEALNNGGQLNSKVIVILNDNRMSISPTAGAMSDLLNRLALSRGVESVEHAAERHLSGYRAGRELVNLGKRIKHGVKEFILPASIWEELGFNYMGPYDGHNLIMLETVFARARDYQGRKPLFIHVITKKGKGYPPAEEDAVRFHGVARSCSTPPAEGLTYSDVFGITLRRLMVDNPKLVAISAAMLEGTSLSDVKDAYPDRVFDVGICEEHATTFAAGLSAGGLVPVFGVYSTFMQRAFDQLIHDICLQDLPAVIALDRAGIVGDDGKTHQGIFDLSYLGLIPNMRIAAPRDGSNLQNMLFSATKLGHPVAIRYPRGAAPGFVCGQDFSFIPEGKAEILRSGKDLTLLAVGPAAISALEAAQQLSELGIEATVIDARWVKPLDESIILDAGRRTGRIITIEENVIAGGFGASVMRLCGNRLSGTCIVKNIGIPDVFVEHASQDSLRRRFGLDSKSITEFVLSEFSDCKVITGEQSGGSTASSISGMTAIK